MAQAEKEAHMGLVRELQGHEVRTTCCRGKSRWCSHCSMWVIRAGCRRGALEGATAAGGRNSASQATGLSR